ncbi:DUF6175 family protein [uncultured Tenacibaculum sp.]|uniref:DUF6175 family protein n=2 Tax=uncultured Tenacibaculum sp. TaxID=174713 RepID=UPI00261F7F7B|nr:DUF6175 family protein [uncultured Tenacibaculum sp.]
MKKRVLFLSLVLNSLMFFAQAKKPTIMIVPSDLWCNKNGYVMDYNNQGTIEKIPNYKQAFQENSELSFVISKINGLMAERGFPLKNMESVLKTLSKDSAEDVMMSSKDSGSSVSESPIDKLKKVAKADIIMQLTWTVASLGPKKQITFNLQGLDSYTDKQIATAAGTGNPSFSVSEAVLLEEAILSHLDNFNNSLQDYFEDLFENGREVVIKIQKWDDWDEDLESSFGSDNEELSVIIEDWLSDNTVKGRYNTTDATENMMLFEQVRIPLYYERKGKQRAMDTRRFVSNLSRYLRGEDFNIVSKVVTNGLGKATIILGGK